MRGLALNRVFMSSALCIAHRRVPHWQCRVPPEDGHEDHTGGVVQQPALARCAASYTASREKERERERERRTRERASERAREREGEKKRERERERERHRSKARTQEDKTDFLPHEHLKSTAGFDSIRTGLNSFPGLLNDYIVLHHKRCSEPRPSAPFT